MKANIRNYSRHSLSVASLLGKQIKLARKQRKWSESELATRLSISRTTLKKIEQGNMKCEIGLVLEAAALVGIKLFDEDTTALDRYIESINDKIALLPKSIRQSKPRVDDDF